MNCPRSCLVCGKSMKTQNSCTVYSSVGGGGRGRGLPFKKDVGACRTFQGGVKSGFSTYYAPQKVNSEVLVLAEVNLPRRLHAGQPWSDV